MKLTNQITISTCIVSRSESSLGECIESVFNQHSPSTEVIVSPLEHDLSENEQAALQNKGIRILSKAKNLAESLNALTCDAKGDYICFITSNCTMADSRLQTQLEYMEQNPLVGVMGTALGTQQYGSIVTKPQKVSLWTMVEDCALLLPTVIIRKSAIEKTGACFCEEYGDCAPYDFFIQLLKKDVKIVNTADALTIQDTAPFWPQDYSAAPEIARSLMVWIKERVDEVKADYTVLPKSGNKLSVVMSFLNEREEVGRTVQSIRETAGDTVDIIVINDHSDKDYDYESDLEGMGVNYFYNDFTIGAAAGKEKGVQISSTPYFILLDAHMRFYDKTWAKRLVADLEADSNRLLCCQTKMIAAFDDDTPSESNKKVLGAHICFERSKMMPGIEWNHRAVKSCLDKNQIPAVLGASYCTSKQYWNRLGGLQGLISYGCEEQYISSKAWLEGGGCYLEEDIVIGHLYRKKAPYSVTNISTVFNYIVNSYTLFPASEFCMSMAVAREQNPYIYKKLCLLLDIYRDELDRLKQYYRQTLTKNTFKFLKDVNAILSDGHYMVFKEEAQRLETVVGTLRDKQLDNFGLGKGKASQLIALACYAHLAKQRDVVAERIVGELLEYVNTFTKGEIDFYNGLCGIGWALVYLLQHEMIDADCDEALSKIDQTISTLDIENMADCSIDTGVGGIMAYIVARIGWAKACGKRTAFSPRFIASLKAVAQKIEQSDINDRRVICLALQCKHIDDDDFQIAPLEVADVVELPAFLPQNKKFQRDGISAKAGFAIYLAAHSQIMRNCKLLES